MLEAAPLTGISEESLTILNGLIADSLPTGATLQLLLWASPKIGRVLETWCNARQGRGAIYEELARQRVE